VGPMKWAFFRRRLLLCVCLAWMPIAVLTSGCVPAPAAAPAPDPIVVSPEVHADGRVTFRFYAPHAKGVSLALEGAEPVPMNDDKGVWSVTTPHLAPDIYDYAFVQDGTKTVDRHNPLLKPNLLGAESLVHVPGAWPWDAADVPRGALHQHFFKSLVIGDDRDFYVYTPPGYDRAAEKAYPTLYLLHGFSDDARAWSVIGRAHVIFDNLIAQGKAAPMIVVMPLGYGAPELLAGGFSGYGKDPALLRRNFERFQESLVGEVLPQVEAAYRVAKDRDSRAIAGLSMGGAESLLTGLHRIDPFAWVGAFSSGGLTEDFQAEFPELDSAAGARLRLLWISCGKDDRLVEIHRKLLAWLDVKGVPHTGVETPGGHDWRVWRRNLAAFASLIFRDRPRIGGQATPVTTPNIGRGASLGGRYWTFTSNEVVVTDPVAL
jgi:enterochelin esterase-like enzyme